MFLHVRKLEYRAYQVKLPPLELRQSLKQGGGEFKMMVFQSSQNPIKILKRLIFCSKIFRLRRTFRGGGDSLSRHFQKSQKSLLIRGGTGSLQGG